MEVLYEAFPEVTGRSLVEIVAIFSFHVEKMRADPKFQPIHMAEFWCGRAAITRAGTSEV